MFAVVRVEPDVMGDCVFRDSGADGLATVITVVSVWGSADEAESEVIRLDHINGPSGAIYFWQSTKFVGALVDRSPL